MIIQVTSTEHFIVGDCFSYMVNAFLDLLLCGAGGLGDAGKGIKPRDRRAVFAIIR